MDDRKPIKPGSRPGKRWCEWLHAIRTWTPEERAVARERADKAWGTRSIRAQYAGLGEMRALDAAGDGILIHQWHCTCGYRDHVPEGHRETRDLRD